MIEAQRAAYWNAVEPHPSVRLRKLLYQNDVGTVEDLAQLSEEDLWTWRSFGATPLAEIRALLAANGLCLRGEGPPPDRYRVELIHDATSPSAIATQLNAWAVEGWRVHHTHVVMGMRGSALDPAAPPRPVPSLLVVLERVRA